MKKNIVWSLVFGVLLFSGKAVAQEPIMYISFCHLVGKDTLQLNETTYHNALGEPFTVNKFKYYISNIVIRDSAGKKGKSYPGLFLIDESNPSSKGFFIGPQPEFGIGSIEFTIGVDSIYNMNGVQSGALDPLNGMFWTWNSGYVFAKLEGQSDSSNAPFHQFMFDVGGYKKGQNAARKVNLDFIPDRLNMPIQVDVLKWFNSTSNISISKTPLCHEPGKFAMQLADNLATMFSIPERKN
jgi:hypothetical protein